jgi:2-keto-4-pentenoate hydratase/2-oxohepta-3-ene-1,7-dioic acid hydratase in catechol pathway
MALTLWDFGDEGWYSGLRGRGTRGWRRRGGVAGWRRNPPLFMRPGDVAEVEISGIGVLRNPVVAEAA